MELNVLFVDDDRFLLDSIQRSLVFSCPDWTAQFAESGEEAIEKLKEECFDAVVSDMRMPGMKGNELLEHVREHYPDAIRVILSGQADKESVIRSHRSAQQYLSKPCQVKELAEILENATTLRKHLRSTKMRQAVAKIERWPVIKAQRTKLEELIGSPSVSCNEIGVEVEKDLAISSNLLRMANSPLLGLNRTVADVTEAVIFLGVESIHSLLMFSDIFVDFEQKKIDSCFLKELANHSVNVGTRALGIAKRAGLDKTMQNLCLLSGLLHDLGKLVMLDQFTDSYADVLAEAKAGNQPLYKAESKVFDANHADVSACLLGLWGIPDQVVEAAALHHCDSSKLPDTLNPLSILHLANSLENNGDRTERLPLSSRQLVRKYSL